MATMTITEALAEIKTTGKRLEKKRAFVAQYLGRQEGIKDPLEREGGSVAALRQERQAIDDLENRIIALRLAIAKANTLAGVTVENRSDSIAAWLVWRREVASERQRFLQRIQNDIGALRKQATQKGLQIVKSEADAESPHDYIINVDERALATEIETIETILGTLDGQLSLANATTMVEVD